MSGLLIWENILNNLILQGGSSLVKDEGALQNIALGQLEEYAPVAFYEGLFNYVRSLLISLRLLYKIFGLPG